MWFRNIFCIPALLFCLVGPTVLFGHELWLEPEKYQAETGQIVGINIRNGENFSGITLSYFPNRVDSFYWAQGSNQSDVVARSGDIPAASVAFDTAGLVSFVYQSSKSSLTYTNWEKFKNFIDHKDLHFALADHQSRGLPETGFKEVYFRFSKALVGINTAEGQDKVFGLETEFVALENPYLDDLRDGFSVALLYQGAPRKNAQIEVFERDPSGTVAVFKQTTDDQGHARISVKPGHQYLLDAVVLRQPSDALAQDTGAVWESLWAALTFEVPQ